MPEEVKDPITNLNVGADSNPYWLNVPYFGPNIPTGKVSLYNNVLTITTNIIPVSITPTIPNLTTIAEGTQIIVCLPGILACSPNVPRLTVTNTLEQANISYTATIFPRIGNALVDFKSGSLLHLYFNGTNWIVLN